MNVSDRLLAALVFAALFLFTSTPLQADERVDTETRVDEVRSAYGLTGEGVIIAVFDRGIDYEHPDFINEDGTTRILTIYDMLDPSGAGDADNPTGFGTVYTEAEINAALDGGPSLAHRDAVGHGTATAGMAGGNGRASGGLYTGIAPEASFIIVKMVSEGAPAHDDEPAEAPGSAIGELDTALDFVLDLADDAGMPVVFLANFGSIQGPSDGTSADARIIQDRFGPGLPGRVFISGTSDDGGHPNHAAGEVTQGQVSEIEIHKGHEGNLRMDLWYDDSDRFDIEIVTPSGTFGPFASPATNGQSDSQTSGGAHAFNYFHLGSDVDFFEAASNTREILIDFTGGTGDYVVRLIGASVANGHFDAVLNPARIFGHTENRFESFVVPGSTVWDLATAPNNIAPNSYVVRESWTDVDGNTQTYVGNDVGEGALWPGSGVGPTYDGRLGVAVSAPGNTIFAPYAPRSYFATIRGNLLTEDKMYGVFSAVSGAAPVLLGIVALMLEADPTLDAAEVEDILEQTASEDAFTGSVPNPNWGYGKVDAYAAVTEVLMGVAIEPVAEVPGALRMATAPNPFNGATQISLDLAEPQPVRVMVYDALGRRVAVLHDGPLASGTHSLHFDVRALPSGVYAVRASSPGGVVTRRVTLLR